MKKTKPICERCKKIIKGEPAYFKRKTFHGSCCKQEVYDDRHPISRGDWWKELKAKQKSAK